LFGRPRLLPQVVFKPHRAMEHAKDVDLIGGAHEIHDTVVAPEQNPQVPPRGASIQVPDQGELLEDLCTA
jgi:hypothetical protein